MNDTGPNPVPWSSPWVHALRWVGKGLALVGVLAGLSVVQSQTTGPDVRTKFTNIGTIGNTRHNLTQQPTNPGAQPINNAAMDLTRNNYGEVCVYCHTPHGANPTTTAPLWNRTMRVTNYQTYDLLGTPSLSQPVTQPGVNSLTCLSCHDGQTAIDAIINMPGSGRASTTNYTAVDVGFLDSWPATNPAQHASLSPAGCMFCHNPTGAGALGSTDFTLFAIGTDLRNDHPVGVRFPGNNGVGSDFNDPQRKEARWAYYDENGNGVADSKEIRFYNTGDGYEVECASCHDPHGVPSGGPGTVFNPSFLRKGNDGSRVCLTCHIK